MAVGVEEKGARRFFSQDEPSHRYRIITQESNSLTGMSSPIYPRMHHQYPREGGDGMPNSLFTRGKFVLLNHYCVNKKNIHIYI